MLYRQDTASRPTCRRKDSGLKTWGSLIILGSNCRKFQRYIVSKSYVFRMKTKFSLSNLNENKHRRISSCAKHGHYMCKVTTPNWRCLINRYSQEDEATKPAARPSLLTLPYMYMYSTLSITRHYRDCRKSDELSEMTSYTIVDASKWTRSGLWFSDELCRVTS